MEQNELVTEYEEPMSDQDRVSLREHYDRIILMEGRLARLEAQLESNAKALDLANEELQRRFDQINHLREEMSKRNTKFADKDITKTIAAIYAFLILLLAGYVAFK